MNFLAHAFLSFDHPAILMGNMISDFVKGKEQYRFDPLVQKGIRLHRSIDLFTDTHPINKDAKMIFRAQFGLYAGAFIDIAYDYFLANDTHQFASPALLKEFSTATYRAIDGQITQAPPLFQQIFPYMKNQDWLYHYHEDAGMLKSFTGMVRRAKYIHDSDAAFQLFMRNKERIRICYDAFFPLLKIHAGETMRGLLNAD